MERSFETQLEDLSGLIQRMGGHVEQSIGQAVQSLVDRNAELARQVIAQDKVIDQLELDADEHVLHVLARYQLAARDLRFLTTAMKILPDLERIGDQAVNVAERALELLDEAPLPLVVDLPRSANRAREMVREVLDAFVHHDADAARKVIHMDDDLDGWTRTMFHDLLAHMTKEPSLINRAVRLAFVAKYFERMGDQATNIAEQIVFMVEGKVLKHARIHEDD
jgi:phosphate transport system protein